MDFKIFAVLLMIISATQGQFYEDRRCRCICPSPSSLLNSTQSDRKVFTSNVPANKCNCEGVILPKIGDELKGHEQEFCPRCECKYETRNTTIILVVVIITLWMLTLLFGYMGFLLCLDPLINKKKVKVYEEAESGSEEAQTLLMQEEPED